MRRLFLILAVTLCCGAMHAQEITVEHEADRDTLNKEAISRQALTAAGAVKAASVAPARVVTPNAYPSPWELPGVDQRIPQLPEFDENRLKNPELPYGFYGMGGKSNYIGLGTVGRAMLGYGSDIGGFSYDIYAGADKYLFDYQSANNFYVGAALNYTFNETWSVSAFGRICTNPAYFSMASYPFIMGSEFGGTLNWQNEHFGLRAGARRAFDPYSGSWQTYPVIVPEIKIGNFSFGMDIGPYLKQGYNQLQQRKSQPPTPQGGQRN